MHVFVTYYIYAYCVVGSDGTAMDLDATLCLCWNWELGLQLGLQLGIDLEACELNL